MASPRGEATLDDSTAMGVARWSKTGVLGPIRVWRLTLLNAASITGLSAW